jgi:hypothetical protein
VGRPLIHPLAGAMRRTLCRRGQRTHLR